MIKISIVNDSVELRLFNSDSVIHFMLSASKPTSGLEDFDQLVESENDIGACSVS